MQNPPCPEGDFHERALTDSGFFEERFFFGSIHVGVSLDLIVVVSFLMPISSLCFELRTPFVSIFESRHFPAVFLLIAFFPPVPLIF